MRAQLPFPIKYFWAFVVLGVFIAILLVFAYTQGSGNATSSCYIQPELPCTAIFVQTNPNTAEFFVVLQNNLATPIFFPPGALKVFPNALKNTSYTGNCEPRNASVGPTVICSAIITNFNEPIGSQISPKFSLNYVTCSPTCSQSAPNTTGIGVVILQPYNTSLYPVTLLSSPSAGQISLQGVVYNSGANVIFVSGANYQIYALPPQGYVFNDWVVAGNVILSSQVERSTTANVTGSGSITANFLREYKIASSTSTSTTSMTSTSSTSRTSTATTSRPSTSTTSVSTTLLPTCPNVCYTSGGTCSANCPSYCEGLRGSNLNTCSPTGFDCPATVPVCCTCGTTTSTTTSTSTTIVWLLTLSPTVQGAIVGSSATLIANISPDVGTSPNSYLNIFGPVGTGQTPSIWASCPTGTTCIANITSSSAGAFSYQADIGAYTGPSSDSCSGAQVCSNQASIKWVTTTSTITSTSTSTTSTSTSTTSTTTIPWSLTLTASASIVPSGTSVTLSAIANQALPPNNYINIFDKNYGLLQSSPYNTLTISVSQAGMTTNTYIADVGNYKNTNCNTALTCSSSVSVSWTTSTIPPTGVILAQTPNSLGLAETTAGQTLYYTNPVTAGDMLAVAFSFRTAGYGCNNYGGDPIQCQALSDYVYTTSSTNYAQPVVGVTYLAGNKQQNLNQVASYCKVYEHYTSSCATGKVYYTVYSSLWAANALYSGPVFATASGPVFGGGGLFTYELEPAGGPGNTIMITPAAGSVALGTSLHTYNSITYTVNSLLIGAAEESGYTATYAQPPFGSSGIFVAGTPNAGYGATEYVQNLAGGGTTNFGMTSAGSTVWDDVGASFS